MVSKKLYILHWFPWQQPSACSNDRDILLATRHGGGGGEIRNRIRGCFSDSVLIFMESRRVRTKLGLIGLQNGSNKSLKHALLPPKHRQLQGGEGGGVFTGTHIFSSESKCCSGSRRCCGS